jgi:hypothetical protein
MMWENMPILTTIDNKMVMPPSTQSNAPVWRLVGANGEILEYQDAHDMCKPIQIKEEKNMEASHNNFFWQINIILTKCI